MEIIKKVEYWLDIADYDMKTARSLQKSERYLYTEKSSSILKQTEELFKWLKSKVK